MKNEQDKIAWYINWAEAGHDANDLYEKLIDTEKKLYETEKFHSRKNLRLEKDLAKARKDYQGTMQTLKKQQETVVKPLITQVAERDDKLTKISSLVGAHSKVIKMLTSVLKFPKLCDMFRRIEKLRMSTEELKEAQKTATLTLR